MTEEANIWRDFQRQFMQLANEEERTPGARRELKIDLGTIVAVEQIETRKDRLLRAYCDYKERPEVLEKGKPGQGFFCLLSTPPCGLWLYSDGVSENFQSRFRVLAARAGVALGCPKGTDSEDLWLHRLYLNLLENNSDQLFAASKENGMILRVCVASATFCARLERQDLEQAGPGEPPVPASQRIRRKLPAASSEQNPSVLPHRREGSQSRRMTEVAPQGVELGEGGVRFVRQGEYTVALPCGTGGGMFESSTVSAVKVSYAILSTELAKVYSIVKAKAGKITGAELRKQFRRSQLAGVADGRDWDHWAEGFSPKNSHRGRPKGAALTFLERKMALNRGTIKSYLSRSKKHPTREK